MRVLFKSLLKLSAVSLFVICATAAHANEPAKTGQFFRLERTPSGSLKALETEIVRFEGDYKGKHVAVDLISAVHIGEGDYYAALNKEFKNYDAVLYELIAPEGIKLPPPSERPKSAVSSVQTAVQELLALEFQLDQIDYQAKNFVHADLSAEAFMEALTAGTGSLWVTLAQLLLRDMLSEDQKSNPLQELKLLMALLASDDTERAYRLRRFLAENFGNVEDMIGRLGGPAGAALIGDRNTKAVSVLVQQLDAGKTRLAIFYGGAHMPDMKERLLKALPLKQTTERWLTAWRLQR